jgi:hypothetical protein
MFHGVRGEKGFCAKGAEKKSQQGKLWCQRIMRIATVISRDARDSGIRSAADISGP